ncbi:MAG: TSUP family transporter, partial [Cyanobacteria bacterium REEB65]|nr:TSUP family transporter [Cyanobacteria bacterium REEB65]
TSAVGGLAGALLHIVAPAVSLLAVFGSLLVFSGILGITGLGPKLRFHGPIAWVAGALSGLLGGFVGNQGGIRSAALLAFELDKGALVATATAIGLIVDAARMPVYLATQGGAIARMWLLLAVSTMGVVVGTLAGERVLRRIPEAQYRRILSALLLGLGAYMLTRAAF